jgi:phosphoenolpyruvate synthase/pyruvate phosphate dikinase
MHPRFKSKPADRMIAKGMNAGPGAAVGKIVLDSESAVALHNKDPKEALSIISRQPKMNAVFRSAPSGKSASGLSNAN